MVPEMLAVWCGLCAVLCGLLYGAGKQHRAQTAGVRNSSALEPGDLVEVWTLVGEDYGTLLTVRDVVGSVDKDNVHLASRHGNPLVTFSHADVTSGRVGVRRV